MDLDTQNILRAELIAIAQGFRDAYAVASEVGEYGLALTSLSVAAPASEQTVANRNKIVTALANRGYNVDFLGTSWTWVTI